MKIIAQNRPKRKTAGLFQTPLNIFFVIIFVIINQYFLTSRAHCDGELYKSQE